MSTSRSITFSRSMNQLVVDGIKASTMESLLALRCKYVSSELVISDLSLGAWRRHQVASEFCIQLGLSYMPLLRPTVGKVTSENQFSYSNIVGDVIDEECQGDSLVLQSFHLTNLILSACSDRPKTFFVILPLNGIYLGRDNIMFIRFIVQALINSFSRLILVSIDDNSFVPTDWKVNWINVSQPLKSYKPMKNVLSLIPGIIDPETMRKMGTTNDDKILNLFPLANGNMLVAPECRRHPSEVSRLEFDKLATGANRIYWLKAYAQFYGNNYFLDPLFLFKHAWEQYLEGNNDVALRLLDRALSCTTDPDICALIRSLSQNIRIALQEFEEAAEVPCPSNEIAIQQRRLILQAKGWALVMCEKPDEAELYLSEARELFKHDEQSSTLGYMYLLNISALNRLKLGDIQGALALENEIEATHLTNPHRDWRLHYVNSINLARLYRRLGKFDMAERYYIDAFSTNLGGRSESDLIYTNFCLSRLNEERGRDLAAFSGWIRTALHWVSCEVPEALSRRVAMGILGYKPTKEENITEDVSRALTSKIFASAKVAKLNRAITLEDTKTEQPPPVFIRSQYFEEGQSGKINSAYLLPGCSMLSTQKAANPQLLSPNHRKLRSILYQLLMITSPLDELTNLQTIVVDSCLGYEIPVTFPELLSTSIRLRIPKIVCGADVIEIDERVRSDTERKLCAMLTNIVQKVESKRDISYVTFKRYYSPKIISKEEYNILSLLNGGISLDHLAEMSGIDLLVLIQLMRSLEKLRIVRLYFPIDKELLSGSAYTFYKNSWSDILGNH